MSDESVLAGHIYEKELAAQLGINLQTLRKWRRLGEAPAHTHYGKTILYRRAAVEKWLKDREQTVAA